MIKVSKQGILWYLFRTPIYIYRWHLGWLFGKRLLLLTHTGRRTGLRRQTVLEVVEYRGDGPDVVVANGFGPDSDWLRNIQAKSDEEVTVGSQHFVACHRFLGEDEAVKVIERYEHREQVHCPQSFVPASPGCWDGSIVRTKVIAAGWSGKFHYSPSGRDFDNSNCRFCGYCLECPC
jgi:deazaflavin-dependent oxidoreductase (nitroreductase family)